MGADGTNSAYFVLNSQSLIRGKETWVSFPGDRGDTSLMFSNEGDTI